MSERRRALTVIVPIVVVLLGGAYGLFGVYLPRQARGAAQDEIRAWEHKWSAARACLLGAQPASSDLRLALGARELMPDPWDTGTCTSRLGELTRSAGVDTGLPEVERAWTQLDGAAIALAKAFADHTVAASAGSLPVEARVLRPDPLPAALEGLGAAHASLREAAGLPPLPPVAAGTIAALPQQPIMFGAERVVDLGRLPIPFIGVYHGATTARDVQITLAPGAAPRLLPYAERFAHAAATGWAVAVEGEQLVLGTVEAAGFIATPGAPTLPAPPFSTVAAAVGTAADGAALVTGPDSFHILRVTGGVPVLGPAIPAFHQLTHSDTSGRYMSVYLDGNGELWAIVMREPASAAPFFLGGDEIGRPCATSTRLWMSGDLGLLAFALDDPGPRGYANLYLDHMGFMACGAHHVLLRKSTTELLVCSDAAIALAPGTRPTVPLAEPRPPTASECRSVTPGPRDAAVTLVGDRVVAAQARDRVLGIWVEGKPPVLAALDEPMEVSLVVSDGATAEVYGRTEAGAVSVRVPLAK